MRPLTESTKAFLGKLNMDNSNLYKTTILIPFRSAARTSRRGNKIADALFYLGNSSLEQPDLYQSKCLSLKVEFLLLLPLQLKQ